MLHRKYEQNKNISGWKPSKNKNNEPHQNNTGSFTQTCNPT